MANKELEQFCEENNMEKIELPWHQKLMMKFAPLMFLKKSARQMKIDDKMIDRAMNLFDGRKIKIEKSAGDQRGFILIIDNKLSLWFYQDGDSFKFDGYEMGPYDEWGDITVFDKKNN